MNAREISLPAAGRVSDAELEELARACDAIAQRGGEEGAIARDIKRFSEELQSISMKVRAFLAK